MTKPQLAIFFKNFSYKPNYHFKWEIAKSGLLKVSGYTVRIDVDNVDAGEEVKLSAYENFNYRGVTEDELLLALRDWIHTIERHEADEWIRLEGDLVFPPHKAKVSLY